MSNDPVQIARYQDVDIVYAGRQFMGPLVLNLVANPEHRGRYADLCGRDIVNVIPLVGWHYLEAPVSMLAIDDKGNTVGAGWCAPVRADNGQIGSNLSYAVAPDHEGRGLAKLLTAVAFLAHDATARRNQFVNIQCRKENESSTAIARAFGMEVHPNAGFSVVLGDRRVPFHGYRMDVPQFREAAVQALEKRGMHELLALINDARESHVSTDEAVCEKAEAPH